MPNLIEKDCGCLTDDKDKVIIKCGWHTFTRVLAIVMIGFLVTQFVFLLIGAFNREG